MSYNRPQSWSAVCMCGFLNGRQCFSEHRLSTSLSQDLFLGSSSSFSSSVSSSFSPFFFSPSSSFSSDRPPLLLPFPSSLLSSLPRFSSHPPLALSTLFPVSPSLSLPRPAKPFDHLTVLPPGPPPSSLPLTHLSSGASYPDQ